MAIIDLDDATNKCSGGNNGNPQAFFCFKHDLLDGAVTPGIGNTNRYQSYWQMVGVPSHGSPPGATAINPTNATSGALGQANASGGRTLVMCAFQIEYQLGAGEATIADRLATISSLVGNVNTVQNITGLSVNRYTGTESVGNEIWLEIYTQIGNTSTTVKATYTNQAGVGGQVTPLVGIGGTGLQEAQSLIRLPLAAGDSGVRSVESIQLTATTGVAGDIGVTIMRQLTVLEAGAVRSAYQQNLLGPDFGPIAIKDNACLFFYLNNTTLTPFSAPLLFIEV